jgi:hypothetical protein
MKETATLFNRQQAHQVFTALWERVKAELQGGKRLQVSVKPETRREAQNRLLHAALQDVSAQASWAGRKHDILVWKRLITAAWLRTKGEHAEMIPALDGHGFDVIYEKTSELSVADCADLCDYLFAWGAENGVRFTAPQERTTQ